MGDGSFSDGNTSPPKRRRWWWLLGIGAAVSLVSLIICCGVLTYGFSMVGWKVFEPVRMELNAIAQVQESAGRVDKLTMNFSESTKEGQSNPGFVVLDAETTNGPYQFSIKIGAEAQIEQGFMIHPDGTREELKLNGSGNNADESPDPVETDPDAVDASSDLQTN
ncbi:hypothetical protein Pla100_25510 [Neorhodopirellula pilleata]|uniref:Cytochrome oxidase complex assembly protein 1 n=2 Tax=Neorhodopirellula pilleata TaxID=2714738 RepID=A0A5C6ACS4_9BACT|nr:hypothetical protein Pla100_25510 [Neorhodopirellula pilleata]